MLRDDKTVIVGVTTIIKKQIKAYGVWLRFGSSGVAMEKRDSQQIQYLKQKQQPQKSTSGSQVKRVAANIGKMGLEGRGPQTQSNSIMMLTVHDYNNHTNETNSNWCWSTAMGRTPIVALVIPAPEATAQRATAPLQLYTTTQSIISRRNRRRSTRAAGISFVSACSIAGKTRLGENKESIMARAPNQKPWRCWSLERMLLLTLSAQPKLSLPQQCPAKTCRTLVKVDSSNRCRTKLLEQG